MNTPDSSETPTRKLKNFDECLRKLQDLHVQQIRVEYSGGGDEGTIHLIEARLADDKEVDLPSDLQEEIERFCEQELIPDGYQNCDGGEGRIEFNLATRQLTHSHGDYETILNKKTPRAFTF